MTDETSDTPPVGAPDDVLDAALPRNEPMQDQPPPAKGLILVATPIGNLGDVSLRAVAALRAADVALCEDTRRTLRLFVAHGITTKLLAFHEHNEDARIETVLRMLRDGRTVALVSDAGMPLVSDPGYRLVRAAIAAGHNVTGVPGPNAGLLALVLSGLPPQPYLFLGFPPPRQAARLAAFAGLRAAERTGLSATLVWYAAPHRLAETLADMASAFGDRPAAVARELTKRFEELRRAGLAELAAHYASNEARGEITVVVGPAPAETLDGDDLDSRLRTALETHSLKDAVALVAAALGVPRKLVYARALDLANG